MKKDDTDPGLGPADQGATDPGPPPETTTDPGPPDAESLLENLGGAPLPAPGIPATDGHVAAAYSAGAHKPPRAHKTAPPEAAVVVEKTRPPEPAVPAVPAVPARGMSDEERAARQARTLPGERLRPPPPREEPTVVPMRSGMGARSLAVALVGVLILAGSVVIVLSRTPATPAGPAAGSAAALPVVPSPGVVETTAATAASVAPVASAPEVVPSPEVPSPEASASATVPTPAASPAPSSRTPRPAPRGPSNVVEPERTF